MGLTDASLPAEIREIDGLKIERASDGSISAVSVVRANRACELRVFGDALELKVIRRERFAPAPGVEPERAALAAFRIEASAFPAPVERSLVLRCTFCGLGQSGTRKVIAGPTSFICEECIGLCNDILAEERRRGM